MNGNYTKGQTFVGNASESSIFYHSLEFFLNSKNNTIVKLNENCHCLSRKKFHLCRELSNAFNQILIRWPISCHKFTHCRYYLKGIIIISPVIKRQRNNLKMHFCQQHQHATLENQWFTHDCYRFNELSSFSCWMACETPFPSYGLLNAKNWTYHFMAGLATWLNSRHINLPPGFRMR